MFENQPGSASFYKFFLPYYSQYHKAEVQSGPIWSAYGLKQMSHLRPNNWIKPFHPTKKFHLQRKKIK